VRGERGTLLSREQSEDRQRDHVTMATRPIERPAVAIAILLLYLTGKCEDIGHATTHTAFPASMESRARARALSHGIARVVPFAALGRGKRERQRGDGGGRRGGRAGGREGGRRTAGKAGRHTRVGTLSRWLTAAPLWN